jgi:hypothetical protein
MGVGEEIMKKEDREGREEIWSVGADSNLCRSMAQLLWRRVLLSGVAEG